MIGDRLRWYGRRLGAMSVAEIAHRIGEQARRRIDSRRHFDWPGGADASGPVHGLPGLAGDDIPAPLRAAAHASAEAAKMGTFAFLGERWPVLHGQAWWRGDAWSLDPQTGRHWPGADGFAFAVDYRHDRSIGDPKFVWELNRLQFVPAMALDAAQSQDAAAAAGVFAIIEAWMAANPPYRGINWTSGIELATRIVSVLAAVALTPRDRLPAQAGSMLASFVAAHAYWIDRYPSLHSSANNHRVAELGGLLLAGLCVPEMRDAARHRDAGRAGLEREALRQFHRDGVGVEQSPTYAAYSLEWMVIAGVAGDRMGRPFSPAYRAALVRAAEALRWLVDGGGRTPRIGDDDEGRVLALGQGREDRYVASVVALAERWLGRPEIPPALRDPDLRDLLVPAGVSETAGPEGVRTFVEGGYTAWRLARPSGLLLVVFDHGPLGFEPLAAHGHADALSMWLHFGDDPVMVDAGTFRYGGGREIRDLFRGTLAHNTIAIDGRDQSQIAGAFNWSRKARVTVIAASEDEVIAEHDGYADLGIVHRRSVARDGDAFVVTDMLRVDRQDAAGWTGGFSVAPEATVAVEGRRATIAMPSGRTVEMVLEAGPVASWRIAEGEYAPAFNVRQGCRRLMLDGPVEAGERIVACVRITAR